MARITFCWPRPISTTLGEGQSRAGVARRQRILDGPGDLRRTMDVKLAPGELVIAHPNSQLQPDPPVQGPLQHWHEWLADEMGGVHGGLPVPGLADVQGSLS
jgi:hypothetical protein